MNEYRPISQNELKNIRKHNFDLLRLSSNEIIRKKDCGHFYFLQNKNKYNDCHVCKKLLSLPYRKRVIYEDVIDNYQLLAEKSKKLSLNFLKYERKYYKWLYYD